MSVTFDTASFLDALVFFDILVFLDDVVGLVDAKFAGFGEVGDGVRGVVEQEVKDASVEVGFGEVVVLFDDTGEAFDGFVDVASLCLLESLFEGVEHFFLARFSVEFVGVFAGEHEFGFLFAVLHFSSIFAFIFGHLFLGVIFDEFLVVVKIDL